MTYLLAAYISTAIDLRRSDGLIKQVLTIVIQDTTFIFSNRIVIISEKKYVIFNKLSVSNYNYHSHFEAAHGNSVLQRYTKSHINNRLLFLIQFARHYKKRALHVPIVAQ